MSAILDAMEPLRARFDTEELGDRFQLTRFEREILLLCASAEVSPEVQALCAEFHRDGVSDFPTFALALACLPEPEWFSITPEGTLRRFLLIELAEGASFCRRRIRLPERILHCLRGFDVDDPALSFIEPMRARRLLPSQDRLAEEVAGVWRGERLLPICLSGPGALDVAAGACGKLGLAPHFAHEAPEGEDLLERWGREAILRSAALLVKAGEGSGRLARRARFPLFLVADEPLRLPGTVSFHTGEPPRHEWVQAWRDALGPEAESLNGKLESLSNQFRLSLDDIRDVAARASRPEDLWSEAKRQARRALEGLAERIESCAGWEDIVLPAAQQSTLRQIEAHVRQRSTVYHEWGFADRSNRGLAVSALFSGPSGTGKTLAAEVLAGSLNLDLYRIDLSQVVSKYIGETEKNLRSIFEAAEGSGAVLLFDEADALFGKRSEVKDSHDRYANIEVAYLLQRMEAYAGLVILTTNLKNTLDPAFLRRIRFVVQFPFPEFDDRRLIWQTVFPDRVPLEGFDADRLAGLSLTGGSIRNVALNAAFLAADESSAVKMAHLERAARSEFAKLERPMSELEGIS
ncbi:MAG TPA: ATP-binding protein [Fimbriimonas sp.]